MTSPRYPHKREWLALIDALADRGLTLVELELGEMRAVVAPAEQASGGSHVRQWQAKSARAKARSAA